MSRLNCITSCFRTKGRLCDRRTQVFLKGQSNCRLFASKSFINLRASPQMFPSLAISPWRCFYFIFAKFESIIHKNGQKAWGSSASSDNFSAHPLLSRDEHVTNDSAERDGSSWRMCTLICFLRSLFLDKFFCESSRFISSQRRMCFCHPHTKQRTERKQAWWNLLRSLSILKTFHSRTKKIDNESRFRRREDPRK